MPEISDETVSGPRGNTASQSVDGVGGERMVSAHRLAQVFVIVLGFVLSLRVTTAWGRFWEGAASMVGMTTSWDQSCAESLSFISASLRVHLHALAQMQPDVAAGIAKTSLPTST